MKCRFCEVPLKYIFLLLGSSPLANSYLKKEDLQKPEIYYPLEVYVCDNCFLVQLLEYESRENIFTEYAYFSSYSDSWLKHCSEYVEKMIKRFRLDQSSFVVEIASNDGYLLQYFKNNNIPVLGIEPASNVAKVARNKGIPTEDIFFGENAAIELKSKGKTADFLVGNNVLAHTPNLNDFVRGLKILLKPNGIITIEFPHLQKLIDENQFDTIYHEHFSYFSFITVQKVFTAHGLTIFDVEELPTHGGSLRIYAKHENNNEQNISKAVNELKERELNMNFTNVEFYLSYAEKVKFHKRKILKFLIDIIDAGKKIVAYGAPAKGNTLLNYCGIRTDFIQYTVDKNPYKQGNFLPGTRIPINSPDKIKESKPDYLLILPWNIKEEIIKQNDFIREWGGKFIILIPDVAIL